MLPIVSVILVNWNNWQETELCLNQIVKLDYDQSRLEIIVVDNGSMDDSVNSLRSHSGIKLLKSETNVGFAAGSNIGIKHALHADSELILLLNNDTILPSFFLEPLIKAVDLTRNIKIVSPKINYVNPSNIIWYAGGMFRWPRILGSMVGQSENDNGQWDSSRKVDFAVGCCMLIHRSVFEEIGLLDENFFFYHEDIDFCYRASLKGIQTFFEPKSVIYHKVALSTQNNIPMRIRLFNQARMVFLSKHISGINILWTILFELIRFFRTLLSFSLKREWSSIRAYFDGNISGLQKGIQVRSKKNEPSEISDDTRNKKWKWVKKAIGPILFLLVFSYLIVKASAGIKEIIQANLVFKPEYLVLSFTCQLVGVLVAALIWSDILKKLGVASNYGFDLQAYVISAIARKVPGFLVYAVSRLVIYDLINASKIRVSIGMVVEMVMMSLGGMITFIIVTGKTYLPPQWIGKEWYLICAVIVIVLTVCLLSPRIIRFFLRKTNQWTPETLGREQQDLKFIDSMKWIIGDILVILLAGGVVFFVIKSIDMQTSIPYTSVLGAFSLTVAIGPFAIWMPGDIGLKDGFLFLAIRPWVGASFAAVVTLAARIWVSFLEIVFGLVGIFFFSQWKKAHRENHK